MDDDNMLATTTSGVVLRGLATKQNYIFSQFCLRCLFEDLHLQLMGIVGTDFTIEQTKASIQVLTGIQANVWLPGI